MGVFDVMIGPETSVTGEPREGKPHMRVGSRGATGRAISVPVATVCKISDLNFGNYQGNKY